MGPRLPNVAESSKDGTGAQEVGLKESAGPIHWQLKIRDDRSPTIEDEPAFVGSLCTPTR